MEPKGIIVNELDLNLPGGCYYLYWEPGGETGRGHREAMRAVGREMGWATYATGTCYKGCSFLFGIVESNLDAGLARLLPGRAHHRLFLVDPESALQQVAEHIRKSGDAAVALPERHYGLFIGDRIWAERMLTRLMNRAAAAGSDAACRSLAEIAKAHSDRRTAITEAYRMGGFTLKDIAEHFDMHFSEVSAIINRSHHDCRC